RRDSSTHFADRVGAAIEAKQSILVVGLDPILERMPDAVRRPGDAPPAGPGWTEQAARSVLAFAEGVVDAVKETAVALKPNTAFFERFGAAGWQCLLQVCGLARSAGLQVIVDAKRGDIGHTAEAYADALLGSEPGTVGPVTDAVTLNPWLGSESLAPFLRRARESGKGLFVLVRTSNPSAGEIQELVAGGCPVYQHVARLVHRWGEGLEGDCGLSAVGAVVGATAPEQAAAARSLLPRAIFLIPGFGAQGGRADQLSPLFLPGGRGALVNASRSVIFAHETSDLPWRDAVRRAAEEHRAALERIRSRAVDEPPPRG
ncbi:MAG: orotidine-5'-phosphate decarboxylase, partial [Planctomycetes bacterium]|nr:orotidine-5'-phosphate decarboxylase [Planctomycetota bacterium]